MQKMYAIYPTPCSTKQNIISFTIFKDFLMHKMASDYTSQPKATKKSCEEKAAKK